MSVRRKALVWIVRPGPEVLILERPGKRGGGHHPVTGKADWVPVLDDSGAWHGVHSRSDAPASIRFGTELQLKGARRTKVSDHVFLAAAPASAAASLPAGSETHPPEPDLDPSK